MTKKQILHDIELNQACLDHELKSENPNQYIIDGCRDEIEKLQHKLSLKYKRQSK